MDRQVTIGTWIFLVYVATKYTDNMRAMLFFKSVSKFIARWDLMFYDSN